MSQKSRICQPIGFWRSKEPRFVLWESQSVPKFCLLVSIHGGMILKTPVYQTLQAPRSLIKNIYSMTTWLISPSTRILIIPYTCKCCKNISYIVFLGNNEQNSFAHVQHMYEFLIYYFILLFHAWLLHSCHFTPLPLQLFPCLLHSFSKLWPHFLSLLLIYR